MRAGRSMRRIIASIFQGTELCRLVWAHPDRKMASHSPFNSHQAFQGLSGRDTRAVRWLVRYGQLETRTKRFKVRPPPCAFKRRPATGAITIMGYARPAALPSILALDVLRRYTSVLYGCFTAD